MAAPGMAATAASAMRAPPTLDALLAARTVWHAGRSAIADLDAEPTGHAALDVLLPQGGWPPRALTELLLPADGIGELSLLLPTLARLTQAGDTVALVAPPYLPYAPAWQSAGVDLAQLQVIDAAPRDALWAFEQCLRSGACAAVLGWPATGDAQALRRLQVAADSGQCLAFALRDRRHAVNASPAALRIEAVRDAHAGIGWHVRKCRGGNVPARAFMPSPREAAVGTDDAACSRSAGDTAGADGIRAQANCYGQPPASSVGAALAATAKANGAAGNASPKTKKAEGIRAQARSHMPSVAIVVSAPKTAGAVSPLVGAAMAANAVACSRSAGNTADASGIRAQARSYRKPPPSPVGSASAAIAVSNTTKAAGIRAQARPHMPRPWPRRSHPHDPRTLFD